MSSPVTDAQQCSDIVERVARALYAQWSEFVFKHSQTELRRFDELGDDLKATWIDRAKAALEASHHAELVSELNALQKRVHDLEADNASGHYALKIPQEL